MVKEIENPLGFDKVIDISWVVHFFGGTQCRQKSTMSKLD